MFFFELWSAFLAWWRRRPAPTDLGALGERLAETHYLRQGGRCLAMNWRHGRDELDLVVLEGEVLVFVEVKTRTAKFGGEGYWAVNRRKKRALRRAARSPEAPKMTTQVGWAPRCLLRPERNG